MAHVLVVDDEKSLRITLSEFLTDAGHEVDEAEDAHAALARLTESDFDVVVSDIIMPRLTGMGLLKKINEAAPHVQVILITGEPTVKTASEAVRAGAFDYLAKPVEGAGIVRVVEAAAKLKAAEDESRRLEAENERYRRHLEELVDERTEALREANEDLERALEDLRRTQEQIVQQERLRALGQMASGIAHDFNNALMPVVGFSELLLNSPHHLEDRDKAQSYLGAINTSAQDAASVVRRLREFYRPREEDEAFGEVSVPDLIKQSISLTQPKWKDEAQAKGVHIEIDTDLERVPTVAGDERDLREVLTNLIFNAADAMPEGGVLTLGARTEGGHVTLEVCDTGTGMTEEVRRRCLEPFFTTKGEDGTGLGLSMIHGIIRRHEGILDIESEPGEGTTFRMRLPVWSGQHAAREEAIAQRPARSLHVLVVDDEFPVRDVVREYLVMDGHTVQTAADGVEGLAAFGQGKFDLILTDRAMPEMGGDELVSAIAATAPNKPIIMLTGFGDQMQVTGERPPGVDAVVAKPVTIEALRAAVAKVMQIGQGDPPCPAHTAAARE